MILKIMARSLVRDAPVFAVPKPPCFGHFKGEPLDLSEGFPFNDPLHVRVLFKPFSIYIV